MAVARSPGFHLLSRFALYLIMASFTVTLETQATLGDTNAMCTLAALCDKTTVEGKAQAIQWYGKAAEAGCGIAMHALGCIYSNDDNLPAAVQWYERSVAAGQDGAMASLAVLYAAKMHDNDMAIHWLDKCGELSSNWVMTSLGDLYYRENDIPKALFWHHRAVAAGNVSSMSTLAKLYANKGDHAIARIWQERAQANVYTGGCRL